jgi:hypothetical protein
MERMVLGGRPETVLNDESIATVIVLVDTRCVYLFDKRALVEWVVPEGGGVCCEGPLVGFECRYRWLSRGLRSAWRPCVRSKEVRW